MARLRRFNLWEDRLILCCPPRGMSELARDLERSPSSLFGRRELLLKRTAALKSVTALPRPYRAVLPIARPAWFQENIRAALVAGR